MLCQIASGHVENGVYEEALKIAEEAIALCREKNDRQGYRQTVAVLARNHPFLGLVMCRSRHPARSYL